MRAKEFSAVKIGRLYRVHGPSTFNRTLVGDCELTNGTHHNWMDGRGNVDLDNVFLVLKKEKPCLVSYAEDLEGRLYVVLCRNGQVGWLHVYKGDRFEELHV